MPPKRAAKQADSLMQDKENIDPATLSKQMRQSVRPLAFISGQAQPFNTFVQRGSLFPSTYLPVFNMLKRNWRQAHYLVHPERQAQGGEA